MTLGPFMRVLEVNFQQQMIGLNLTTVLVVEIFV